MKLQEAILSKKRERLPMRRLLFEASKGHHGKKAPTHLKRNLIPWAQVRMRLKTELGAIESQCTFQAWALQVAWPQNNLKELRWIQQVRIVSSLLLFYGLLVMVRSGAWPPKSFHSTGLAIWWEICSSTYIPAQQLRTQLPWSRTELDRGSGTATVTGPIELRLPVLWFSGHSSWVIPQAACQTTNVLWTVSLCLKGSLFSKSHGTQFNLKSYF